MAIDYRFGLYNIRHVFGNKARRRVADVSETSAARWPQGWDESPLTFTNCLIFNGHQIWMETRTTRHGTFTLMTTSPYSVPDSVNNKQGIDLTFFPRVFRNPVTRPTLHVKCNRVLRPTKTRESSHPFTQVFPFKAERTRTDFCFRPSIWFFRLSEDPTANTRLLVLWLYLYVRPVQVYTSVAAAHSSYPHGSYPSPLAPSFWGFSTIFGFICEKLLITHNPNAVAAPFVPKVANS